MAKKTQISMKLFNILYHFAQTYWNPFGRTLDQIIQHRNSHVRAGFRKQKWLQFQVSLELESENLNENQTGKYFILNIWMCWLFYFVDPLWVFEGTSENGSTNMDIFDALLHSKRWVYNLILEIFVLYTPLLLCLNKMLLYLHCFVLHVCLLSFSFVFLTHLFLTKLWISLNMWAYLFPMTHSNCHKALVSSRMDD